VVDFSEDINGDLWIATNGDGLLHFNHRNNQLTTYSTKENINNTSICHDWLTTLYLDSKGDLWIGSFWGLSRFDIEKKIFKNYSYDPSNIRSISDNIIYSIAEDRLGNIWVGTSEGLNLLGANTESFIHYSVEQGLPNQVINSILVDDKNNIWLATNNGLSKFNHQTKEFINFFYQDGLVSNEFIHNSKFKSSKGELFFGSVFGFNAFYPDSIKVKDFFPHVIITDFKIFNESVPIKKLSDGRVLLKKAISETEEISLDYYDNSFSFDFIAIDYVLPEKINYACKMEGFEESWNFLDYKRRFITYTNLNPGDYTFLVKASSRKNEWGNNITRINIHIRPPIWQTGWAYSVYIVVFMGIIILLWKINDDRITEKNQVRIERIKQAQDEKLNQAKLEFFTNISHEFRTPLTLIIGPIENLLANEKLNKNIRKTLSMMSRNAHRLLRLVNQLLDLRKIEKNKLKLEACKSDILFFAEEIFQSFQELARRKNIQFEFEKNDLNIDVYFDSDKLDKILFNLLSNAFKFTPDNRLIRLIIQKNNTVSDIFPDGFVQIIVEDNGVGMSQDTMNKIFDRFYQYSESAGSVQKGTGIGLSLTKSLVELHHGQIKVESSRANGSKFSVLLPLGRKHFNDNEIIEETINNAKEIQHQPMVLKEFENDSLEPSETSSIDESAPLILIVEDNADVRTYIKEGLRGLYRIVEAENGKEAVKLTYDLMPDLIISDVMMPEMDGITLCKKLKTELVSCHIPVILLTARSSIEHRIEGLETGADSYIPKPFNPKHLLVRVKKLLELRQTLKEKYKSSAEFEPIEMAVTSADEKFMKKAIETIKNQISDPELSVESLGKEIGMSRGHLHRKLKALLGQTPSEFIKTIRLKQAAHLLANEDIPVSEITDLVGFSSPSYFAICFNKMYGLTPTQYKEKYQKK
ncbi:MAG: response regulator, partial [Bacteroidales bacterium]|nr:response regulator [Bacteroidales bacterium]